MNNNLSIELKDQEWYKDLIENCESAIAEASFTAKWALVQGYHRIGRLIDEKKSDFQKAGIFGMDELVHNCAVALRLSERTIFYAVAFYKKFPDLDDAPFGKDTSWSTIKHKYLSISKTTNQQEQKAEIKVLENPANDEKKNEDITEWALQKLEDDEYFKKVTDAVLKHLIMLYSPEYKHFVLTALRKKMKKGSVEHSQDILDEKKIIQEIFDEALDLIGWRMLYFKHCQKKE